MGAHLYFRPLISYTRQLLGRFMRLCPIAALCGIPLNRGGAQYKSAQLKTARIPLAESGRSLKWTQKKLRPAYPKGCETAVFYLPARLTALKAY